MFDRFVALVLFLFLSPVLVVALLAVSLTSPGGPLFRQQRVGRQGKPFTLLKIRSMAVTSVADRPATEVTAADDPRVTTVGKVLRRLKIDELPSL